MRARLDKSEMSEQSQIGADVLTRSLGPSPKCVVAMVLRTSCSG